MSQSEVRIVHAAWDAENLTGLATYESPGHVLIVAQLNPGETYPAPTPIDERMRLIRERLTCPRPRRFTPSDSRIAKGSGGSFA